MGLSRIGMLTVIVSLSGFPSCRVLRPARVPSIPPVVQAPTDKRGPQAEDSRQPPEPATTEKPKPLPPPQVASPSPDVPAAPGIGVEALPQLAPPPPASSKPARAPAPPTPAGRSVPAAPPPPPIPPATVAPKLTELLDESAGWKHNQEIDDRLARTNQLLQDIEKRSLSNDQMVVLDRVRSFVRQATDARAQDLAIAHSLAGRGLLLAQDLDRTTR